MKDDELKKLQDRLKEIEEQEELLAYKFKLTPFKLCPVDRIIIFFGYPLLGGWLPYIGFKTFYNERDEPMRTFMMEWFLRSMLFHSNKDEDWYE